MRWIVVVVVWSIGCATAGPKGWTEVRPAAIQPESQQVFVITGGQASLLDVTDVSNGTLEGVAHRVWTFAPTGGFTIHDNESPTHVAQRLKWTELGDEPQTRQIALAEIRYASAYREREHRTFGGAAGVAAAVVLALFTVPFVVLAQH